MNLDRKRKLLFDAEADRYDRYRPGYPAELFDDLAAYSGVTGSSRILEIGSGTGKATLELARRGFQVECVERGERLCEVLAAHCREFPGVTIRTAEYEHAALDPDAYDMIVSAQAFHWVLPSVRYRRTWLHLKAGGTLAVFWNYFPDHDNPALCRVNELLRVRVPKTLGKPAFPYRKTISRWRKELSRQSAFENLSITEYPWTARYSAEEYAELHNTYSDFLSLPVPLRKELSDEIRTIVNEAGGYVVRPYVCVLYCMKKRRWENLS